MPARTFTDVFISKAVSLNGMFDTYTDYLILYFLPETVITPRIGFTAQHVVIIARLLPIIINFSSRLRYAHNSVRVSCGIHVFRLSIQWPTQCLSERQPYYVI